MSNRIIIGPHDEPEETRNLYVASLPPDFTDAKLFELFKDFGPIKSHKVIIDEHTQKCKGYGFVLFERSEAAARAIARRVGTVLDSQVVPANGDAFRIQVRPAHAAATASVGWRQQRRRSSSSLEGSLTSFGNGETTAAPAQQHPPSPSQHSHFQQQQQQQQQQFQNAQGGHYSPVGHVMGMMPNDPNVMIPNFVLVPVSPALLPLQVQYGVQVHQQHHLQVPQQQVPQQQVPQHPVPQQVIYIMAQQQQQQQHVMPFE